MSPAEGIRRARSGKRREEVKKFAKEFLGILVLLVSILAGTLGVYTGVLQERNTKIERDNKELIKAVIYWQQEAMRGKVEQLELLNEHNDLSSEYLTHLHNHIETLARIGRVRCGECHGENGRLIKRGER